MSDAVIFYDHPLDGKCQHPSNFGDMSGDCGTIIGGLDEHGAILTASEAQAIVDAEEDEDGFN